MSEASQEQMNAILLRGIANVSGDMIAAIDSDFRFTFFNESYRKEYRQLWELEIQKGTNLLDGMAHWPEEKEKARAVWQRALDGEAYTITMEFGPSEAEMRYYALRFAPILDGDTIAGAAHIISDVTAQVRAENHRELLIRELNHRVKNTLAMVQAMARQTFTGEEHRVERERFEARLSNLASAHDMLSNTHWEYTAVDQVITSTMAGAGVEADRFTAHGENGVILGPEQSVTMSMALHELAINAVKFGALSNETGKISIVWSLKDDGKAFELEWQEQGGPTVNEPGHEGFGMTMVRKALANELQGEVDVTFSPEGLYCRVTAPLASEADS